VNSGDRVLQEGNMAQALQDSRSQAASGAQSLLQQYQDQEAATKAGDADSQTQALSDAYNRYVQQYLANPPATSASPSGGSTAPSSGTPAPKAKGSAKKIAHKSKHGRKK